MHDFEEEKQLYVAHIDILGMSSLLRHSNTDAWLMLCDLAEATDTQELPITDSSRKTMSEKFFSDTVIIRSENDTIGSLHTIIARVFELFRCAFRCNIPLRAGIAHGSWFEAKSQG
jgi:hypothetical protein